MNLRRAALALAATAGLLAGSTAVAPAAAPVAASSAAERCGPAHGVPLNQVSIQLYTFAEYVGGGEDAATLQRLRGVLAELADIGYRNVEPYTYYGMTARRFGRMLDRYGLDVPSRHGNPDPAGWAQQVADSRTLGQRWTGSGGSPQPGTGSYEDTLATASVLDRLGRMSVEGGTGKVFLHNHREQFTARYTDPFTGEETSAWELLVAHTDPRYVTYQLDTGWAAAAGEDVPRLIRRHAGRIDLLHVKDGILGEDDLDQRPLGTGELDLPRTLRAAKQAKVRSYVFEQDPVFGGEVDDMLDEARTSFDYLDCVRY